MRSKNQPEIDGGLEPGLLSVFRLIIAVMAGVQLLGISLVFGFGRTGERGTILVAMVAMDLLGMVALLSYLYSQKLLLLLKKRFLPIALISYTVGAVGQRYLFLQGLVNSEIWTNAIRSDRPNFVAQDSAWGTLLALLVPLVMVAWQFDFRRVAIYVFSLALFEAPFIWFFHPAELARIEDVFLFSGVIRSVIFLAVGYIVTRMIGAQRQQRFELAVANEKLLEHAATLEQLTISRERNRMARELHDTLAHSLSAVSVQLEAVDSAFESSPDDARLLLSKALAQTRSGLAETRRALQSLRASPLDDLGLRLAVQTLAETTAKRGGLQLKLNTEDIGELSPAVEQDVYRIAQEALNNVLKHATADKLEVSLLRPNGSLVLTVKDNGTGFERESGNQDGHFGLQGMVERAESIGAHLEIDSTPGRGTTVHLDKVVE